MFKVIYNNGTYLRSTCQWLSSEYIVYYKIGEWTYPIKSAPKLFIFKTSLHAKKFIHDELQILKDNIEIYKCDAINTNRIKLLANFANNIPQYWENKLSHKKILSFRYVPTGTLSCDAVKLLEKI